MCAIIRPKIITALGLIGCLALLPLAGCVPIGKSMPHAENSNFVPKKMYDADFNTAWSKTLTVLGMNSIPIASSTKEGEQGQIVTGYMEGQTDVGLVSTNSRYKYTIFVARVGPKQTTINISASLEASSTGVGFGGAQNTAGQQWHDVSTFNSDTVTGLQNSLYEKIERSLAA
jgi:hypothetical protein